MHGVFIELYELSQIHGEGNVFVTAEGVHTQHGFQPADNDRKTERIQAQVHQRRLIRKRTQRRPLLVGDLLYSLGVTGFIYPLAVNWFCQGRLRCAAGKAWLDGKALDQPVQLADLEPEIYT